MKIIYINLQASTVKMILVPEAFLNRSRLAHHMARFPEAERRRLHKMICMQCYARNAMRATRCRKCGSRELRPKAKEARKE
jgi:large subunit ribosomal protein L40e